ncbi:MAG: alpha/beta hydrolase [Pseudonocardiales bacterium]|nr:alpha/beta hydrolase [Pseudonocardiales bacterium]
METTVRTGDVELAVETIGDPRDPALLLLCGAASSRDWWDDELCARFAASGRYVVRYDQRDTGRSTSWPAGEPGYTGADLTADALAVLDGLGIDAAHVVGISSGGGVAQDLAIGHPARVRTLTLLSTTAVAGDHGDLPGMSDAVAAAFAEPGPDPDWGDRAAVIEHVVAGERLFTGDVPLDEERLHALAGRVVDRTTDMAATMTNHWILERGEAAPGGMDAIVAPTLVLHGTADPLFPYAHGEALARAIPGARLVPLPGVGHQMPPEPVWDLLVAAVVEHTSGPVRVP